MTNDRQRPSPPPLNHSHHPSQRVSLLGWSDIPLPGDAAAIADERVPYTVDPNIQALIDLYEDLDPANQAAALEIIRTIRRTQNARVVGA